MKPLILLIAIAGCLSAAETPGNAAIKFLRQIGRGELDLTPRGNTAISPHVRKEKLERITNRLQRIGDEIGDAELEIGREKIDGDFAGVVIWKTSGFDPSHMQVFPIGLTKRDGVWLPAPVPASFENCGIGYDEDTRRRLSAMEAWMLRAAPEDLSKLRRQSIARMQGDIEKHISKDSLRKLDARRALERFLQACRKRNSHEIMGFTGGLAVTLPDNWAVRADSITRAASSIPTLGPWRLLMSENVLRATVDIDDEFGPLHASIACLDPQTAPASANKMPQVQLVHLSLTKSEEGTWQVKVPDSFWQPDAHEVNLSNQDLDRDLLDKFGEEIRKLVPAAELPTADAARTALLKALQSGSFPELLSITAIPKDPVLGRMAIMRAAEVWGATHGLPSEQHPLTAHQYMAIDMLVDEGMAAVLYNLFSTRKPDRFEPGALYLEQGGKGWLWSPNPADDHKKPFDAWLLKQEKKWKSDWRALLLHDCPLLTELPAGPAPAEQEASEVIDRWLKAVEAGDITQALAQCAILNFNDSPVMALRNLGYEMVDALRKEGNGAINHILSEGPWTGVGTVPRNAKTQSYTLYPVVNTDMGPRILLEIDLIASSGRGREFLNRANFNRLKNFDAKAADTLEKLFLEHHKRSLGASE